MNSPAGTNDLSKRVIVYRVPAMDAVTVRRDVAYRVDAAGPLTMDLYHPPGTNPGEKLPAVILVLGYSDRGAEAMFGCKFKDMGAYTSWARLLAASGLAAIAYSTREPTADLEALFEFLGANAESAGIDPGRIGLWACSGNVPMALAVLMGRGGSRFACAALTHGYMLDLDGSTAVAEAARTFGFVPSGAGASMDDLPPGLPLFVVRAGRDEMPRLNESIDRFLAEAVSRNLPLNFVNHHEGPHGYDLFQDSESSREVIRQILSFLRFHLLGAPARP
jgi:hypothetical protein